MGARTMSLRLAAASYIYINFALKKKRKVVRWWRVTSHVHIHSGHNHIITLMRRPNTDSTPNKPIMLLRYQLLLHYAVTSQVCTHLCVLGRTFNTNTHCFPTQYSPNGFLMETKCVPTETTILYIIQMNIKLQTAQHHSPFVKHSSCS
jgi:hypothetical protein